METDMFLSYIRQLLKEPLSSFDELLAKYHINREIFLKELLLVSDDGKELKEQSDEGELSRQKHNNHLFIRTVEYWTLILILSLFLFILEFAYIYYKKKQNLKQHKSTYQETSSHDYEEQFTGVLENDFTESTSIVRYRKDSTDESDIDYIELQEKNKNCIDKTKKIVIFSGYYSIFGASIIVFQYMFFQYVVFEYKPLSIEEIKYYVYKIITQ
tara:strand:- start:868 stop:1509 length:642 start_codon:yes stop_codon:yes gene_type:complete